jgi:helicase
MAKDAALALSGTLNRKTQTELDSLASEIEVHGEKTSLTDALSFSISKGASFHHAGLNTEHRRIIENAFKKGYQYLTSQVMIQKKVWHS